MINRRNQYVQDERLAGFTDQLMAVKIQPEKIIFDVNTELAQMQKLVWQIRRTFPTQDVDVEMRNRIRVRLTAEWHRNSSPVQAAPKNFFSSHRTLSLSLAVCVVALIAIFVIFLPPEQISMPGAAGNSEIYIPIAIIIIVIAGIAFWQLRKNHKE